MTNNIFNKNRTKIYNFCKTKVMRNWSDKAFIYVDYFLRHFKFLSLKKPKDFNDKLQWLKLYGGLENLNIYADKYRVRKYVEDKLGSEYLVKLYGVWDNPEDIDYEKLPNQFVLKSTHGSHQIYICKDKSKINKEELVKTMKGWLEEDFYKKTRELQYRDCERKIICEEYIENTSKGLTDYKFYCFNGNPVLIRVRKDRSNETGGLYFFVDSEWNPTPEIFRNVPDYSTLPEKPENLKDLINTAKILSINFPFVRVDLYSVKGRVYFGELTFTPENGHDIEISQYAEKYLGDMLELRRY